VGSNQIVSALLPVLALLTLASTLESVAPLHRQARFSHGRVPTNLTLIAVNLAVGLLLNGVLLAAALWTAERGWGLFQLLGVTGIAAAFATILVLDFATYGAHVALHKAPWLWRVHLVHHVDVSVDATTSYRHHPIEPLFRWVITTIVAVCLGAPIGALALYRSLSALNAILEHANIRVPRWLDRSLVWFWVTPDMHKMHHSRRRTQTDSNYANLFSFYDRLFGTFTSSALAREVRYGIDGFDTDDEQALPALLRLPFKAAIADGDAVSVQARRSA
jgi:sterol desaturase/sphingolipid hydroxylase (fatty acid hydroxylase superfamily)